MGFWLISLLLFVVMMAVLEVLPDTMPMVDSSWLEWAWLDSVLMVVLVLMATALLQLSKIYRQHAVFLWGGRLGLVTTTAMMMFFAVAHVVLFHKNQIDNAPMHTMQVIATVHVDEISDSVFDDISDISYRQKAHLSDIRPVTPNRTQINNPLYSADRLAQHNLETVHYPKNLSVLLNAYPNKNQDFSRLKNLPPNSTVTMTLEISPLARGNGVGFDGYRWLMGRHIYANAKIIAIEDDWVVQGSGIQGLRQKFREHFLKDWHNKSFEQQQSEAVTLSLLTGDRALIAKSTKDLYQFAGISHLLAISGTHVLFLALILAGVATFLIERYAIGFYKILPRWQFRWLIMAVAAVLYALFTGFDVPAVRTVYLLVVMGVARYLLFGGNGFKVLVITGLVMAWLDPYVLWQAGFWLSFVAVALLMRYELAKPATDFKHRMIELIKLQAWLFVAMLPITILIFGKVSVVGFFSNLVAIELFGWLIVPMDMTAGVLYGVVPSVADGLWWLVAKILSLLHASFELLRLISGNAWLRLPIGFGILLLMFLAMLPFLLPRIMPKYLSLPIVCLCLFALGFAKSHDLPSYDNLVNSQNVHAILIKDNQHAWLMLQSNQTRTNETTLSDELALAMSKKGVRSLTGVIVQTPNEHLARTVGVLSQSMMVGEYWQAGNEQSRQGKLLPSACVMGKTWQGDNINIQAVTGWHELPDDTVHDCSIIVRHEQGLFGKQGLIKTMMIDSARHDRLWQLWQMLCQDDNLSIELWLGKKPTVFDNQTNAYFSKMTTIEVQKTADYKDLQ